MRKWRWVFAVLAGIVLVAGHSLVRVIDHIDYRSSDMQDLMKNKEDLAMLSGWLLEYKRDNGRYPTNDEGLSVFRNNGLEKLNRYEMLYLIGKNKRIDRDFIPCTVFGEPFIYENRNGLNPAIFRFSMAARDSKEIYSINVDNGIYVWSLGAQKAWKSYWLKTVGKKFIPVAAPLLAFLLFVIFVYQSWTVPADCERKGIWRTGQIFVGLFAASISLFLSYIPANMFLNRYYPSMRIVMCYVGMWMPPSLTKELKEDYLSLAEKYRDMGVLNEDAYGKIKGFVEKLETTKQ